MLQFTGGVAVVQAMVAKYGGNTAFIAIAQFCMSKVAICNGLHGAACVHGVTAGEAFAAVIVVVAGATAEAQKALLACMAEAMLEASMAAIERVPAVVVLAIASDSIFARPSSPIATTIRATITSTKLNPRAVLEFMVTPFTSRWLASWRRL